MIPANEILDVLTYAADPTWEIARAGSWHGKTAATITVLGRRASFTSTSVSQDVSEVTAAQALAANPIMTGTEDLEVVSSSANDAAAGTGARALRITYIRASDGTQATADVVPNGTTPVLLPTSVKASAIQWMEVTSVGSNAVSAGIITCRVAGGGTGHEQISAGGNLSMSSRYTVPAGMTAYAIDWHSYAVGTTMDMRFRGTVGTDGAQTAGQGLFIFKRSAFADASSGVVALLRYTRFPAGARIKVSTYPATTAGTARCDTNFVLVVVAN